MPRLFVAFALTLVLLASCQLPAPVIAVPKVASAESVPPRTDIRAHPIPIGCKLTFDESLLPKGATGRFSSYDGDKFSVHIPPDVAETVAGKEVFENTIVPLLKAMGYGDRLSELTFPENDGDRLPRANLAQLAAETCHEVESERYQRFHPVCNAMLTGKADPVAERVFDLAYGMTFAQFKADTERQRIQYVFTQRAGGVPIEHIGIIAARWEGATVTSVAGTIFNRYEITNRNELPAEKAIAIAQEKILTLPGVDSNATNVPVSKDAVLVLLPYGSASEKGEGCVPGLRYAWRVLLFAYPIQERGQKEREAGLLSWMAWIDAQDGKILQLLPQFDEEFAEIPRWKRDPTTPVQAVPTQVDAAVMNQATLQRAGVFNRFDRLGDGDFNDDEVSINAPGAINFNQAPLNDAAASQCGGSNNAFRQLNAWAHLNSARDSMVNAGTFPPLPEAAITVWIDSDDNRTLYDADGSGLSRIKYALGTAFNMGGCPDVANANLPGTEDATTLVHELAHVTTKRMGERRPVDWCPNMPCPMPFGRLLFHDFADSVAQAYASIPCQAGWSRKNQGGANNSLNCATHTEELEVKPRLSSIDEPFNPASPKDHFPERRINSNFMDPYADMQILSTAFWLTRQGMRSKCLPSGTPQYWIRWNRALYNFGFIPQTCTMCSGMGDNESCNACDRDIYRYAQDFLDSMTEQWATSGEPGGPPGFAHNGRHSTNKLLSGFARVGIFLVPAVCIDGDMSTSNPTFCPGGEMGGDAIVDVRDNDTTDDTVIDGVTHPEFDYIKRNTLTLPTFRVWTGPRFKFDGTGVASNFTPSMATPSPCHTQYRVELSNDENFGSFVDSGWRSASATAQPQCYDTWTPGPGVWSPLEGNSGDVKVYYRVRTRDSGMANERISTKPGNGSYTIPPAYLIVNNAGQP